MSGRRGDKKDKKMTGKERKIVNKKTYK